MTRKKPTRKRGAQPGNLNALKHGLYIHSLPPQITQKLAPKNQPPDPVLSRSPSAYPAGSKSSYISVRPEIDLLRTLLTQTLTASTTARDPANSVASSLDDQPLSLDDSLRLLTVAGYAAYTIARLTRLEQTNQPSLAEILSEALRGVNPLGDDQPSSPIQTCKSDGGL